MAKFVLKNANYVQDWLDQNGLGELKNFNLQIRLGRSRKDPYPPPRRKFSLSEGGGRKNVLGCTKGGRGKMS